MNIFSFSALPAMLLNLFSLSTIAQADSYRDPAVSISIALDMSDGTHTTALGNTSAAEAEVQTLARALQHIANTETICVSVQLQIIYWGPNTGASGWRSLSTNREVADTAQWIATLPIVNFGGTDHRKMQYRLNEELRLTDSNTKIGLIVTNGKAADSVLEELPIPPQYRSGEWHGAALDGAAALYLEKATRTTTPIRWQKDLQVWFTEILRPHLKGACFIS